MIDKERSEAEFFFALQSTHLFPMHPFSIIWKHQKILRFSDVFRGQRKCALGTNGLKHHLALNFSPEQKFEYQIPILYKSLSKVHRLPKDRSVLYPIEHRIVKDWYFYIFTMTLDGILICLLSQKHCLNVKLFTMALIKGIFSLSSNMLLKYA